MTKTNEDDFNARGSAYRSAFDILHQGCEVPPSLDVFETELMDMRKRTSRAVTPPEAARDIVKRYHRVK